MDSAFIKVIQENNYSIKKGYKSRSNPQYFDDFTNMTWQPQVYALANYLGKYLDCSYVIDIGCGTAGKLVKCFPEFQIIGVDMGSNLEFCQKNYNYGTWINHDLESSQMLNISKDILDKSVIVCSDVIEHLKNPCYLLWNIKNMMNYAPACILSTPERDIVRGKNDFGPPENISHVREWNMNELVDLFNFFSLNIKFTGLTINNDVHKRRETILAMLVNDSHHKAKQLGELKTQTIKDII
ncbi:methyltransferase domain-containing protein [Bacillus cereus]|uniref:Methyltransferase domain-containing protein n=1 Tax=Bacillus cereus VD118 TaxID=1053231 RepID=R8QGB3_BACCE|nr:class I SAM-dependent methyltransferase [Bacillus cereus]EOP70115.1 hypothetical protein IIQ_01399 [Bacillus cereus VD118]